jgi:hypothetical protein
MTSDETVRPAAENEEARPLIAPMRWILLVGAAFVFGAGIQLFVLSERTDRFFAWTVEPPLSAATFGAFYFATWILALLSARERAWSRARLGVPALVPFLILTLAATLMHIDRFHLQSNSVLTLLATWAWILIYVLQPLVLLLVLPLQLRASGTDVAAGPRPPGPFRLVLAVQGAIAIAFGAALFVAVDALLDVWPWMLTDLTARALGAWFVAFGILFATCAWERDWHRIRNGMIALSILGVLLLVALARYSSDVDWDRGAAWDYLIGCVSISLSGLVGWVAFAASRGREVGRA